MIGTGLTDIRNMFGGGGCNIPLIPIQDLINELTAEQIIAVYEGRVSVNIVEYTTVGTHTYTPPSNLLLLYGGCIGGGGGGGSGAVRPSATAMPGQMGAGGGIARRWLTPTQIGASQTVTVGDGGVGGAAVSASATQIAGNAGAGGDTSSFGSLIVALGGNAGSGANANSGVTSSPIQPNIINLFTPSTFPDTIVGEPNQATSATTVLNGVGMFSWRIGSPGNGAYQTSASTANGGNLPSYWDKDGVLNTPSPAGGGIHPGGNGDNGVDNACRQWMNYLGIFPNVGYGQHGAGGAGNINGTAGNGGDGGKYGAGGGGGGAGFRTAGTVTSGKGGNGAQGAVVLFELTMTAPLGPGIPCADATYDVEYPDGTNILSGNIPSGTNEIIVVANNRFNNASAWKTGQTTSYAANDDGARQEGAGVDFFTLSENNPFGNTNRFTDTLGGQTYANDIVVDWADVDYVNKTVGMWDRTVRGGAGVTWAAAMALQPVTSGGYNDWYLPNEQQLHDVANPQISVGTLNYAPFNIDAIASSGFSGQGVWSSTTNIAETVNAFRCPSASTQAASGRGLRTANLGKTTAANYILYRRATFAELGITNY